MRVLILGDIVGKPGRRVVNQQLRHLRNNYGADFVIANGENSAGGSGITPQIYHKLLSYGVDAVTLGDHAFRQQEAYPLLRSEPMISRPANLPAQAVGQKWIRLYDEHSMRPLYIITVLGRMYMNGPLADDPFACVDEFIGNIEESNAAVIVEIHCEATSEKIAMGHHFDSRVAMVFGTHTHIPTADAKILPGGTGYITDLGMTGPYDSVLGRKKERVMQYMTTAMPARFDVAEDDVRLCGVYVEIGEDGLAKNIERVEVLADIDKAPFV